MVLTEKITDFDLRVLLRCPLFANIDLCNIPTLLNCLSAIKKSYKKNRVIFIEGQKNPKTAGIVLSGNIRVYKDDYWGRRSILVAIEQGGLFAESFACARTEKVPAGAYAAEDSCVLFFAVKPLLSVCAGACNFHSLLVHNMTAILAEKNLSLTQKLDFLAQPSTREKLLAYLSLCARSPKTAGTKIQKVFSIPFNRQELADYLSVDRSAMCTELSKLRSEGIIDYKKNSFTLH